MSRNATRALLLPTSLFGSTLFSEVRTLQHLSLPSCIYTAHLLKYTSVFNWLMLRFTAFYFGGFFPRPSYRDKIYSWKWGALWRCLGAFWFPVAPKFPFILWPIMVFEDILLGTDSELAHRHEFFANSFTYGWFWLGNTTSTRPVVRYNLKGLEMWIGWSCYCKNEWISQIQRIRMIDSNLSGC